jgi:hypothetical protein
MDRVLVGEICASVMDSYVDMESPNFGFILERDALNPYNRVFDSLGEKYLVSDINEFTDFNWDSSYGISIKNIHNKILGLSISLVGKYAYLNRQGKNSDSFITSSDDCVDEFEASVLSILLDEGLRMLSWTDIGYRLPIRLVNEDFDDGCTEGWSDIVFNLLFSRTSFEGYFWSGR